MDIQGNKKMEQKHITIKRFLKFLKDEEIYDYFLRNIEKNLKLSLKDVTERMIYMEPCYYVSAFFDWR